MYKLQCPKCHNFMNYQNQPTGLNGLFGKKKTCVYCGKSFKVTDNIVKKM